MTERDLIHLCLQKIELKIKWKRRTEWTDSDYKVLAELISEQTEITISTHTLKRLFGKIKHKEGYNPQHATKDALAIFLGYESWYQFSQQEFTEETPEKSKKVYLLTIPIVLVLLLIVGYYSRIFSEKTVIHVTPKVEMSTDTTIGEVPLTISFKYDLDALPEDSVYIDFGYAHHFRGYQRSLLSSEQDKINHCFQVPGIYNVSIRNKDSIFATIPIHALSDNWLAKILNGEGNPLERVHQGSSKENDVIYYGQNNILLDKEDDGWLYLSPDAISNAGFANNQVYYLNFQKFFDTGLSADNFIYEARFKNSMDFGGITCFDSRMEIYTETRPIHINFVEQGCHRYTSLAFSEYFLSGEYDDLYFLGRNLEEWNELLIKNTNKNVEIIFNGELIHSLSYQNNLGIIKGLGFRFKGSGIVDWVRLRRINGEVVYSDSF